VKDKPASQPVPAAQFDPRDFRRALGQYATGVAVVTTRTKDGRRVGLTVNSFTSVSLDPPLVLWCLTRDSSLLADFTEATHFAINVLAARQHHLSRQFATELENRFGEAECLEGRAGCPLIQGATAHFICRSVRQHDAGDHVIFIGEVEDYQWAEGEPLIFHSGSYHVRTRHPDVPE
jgi:flavin reductase (DIM6/NTAB) family NADH-FMN oxidoreductase RutF